MAKVDKFKTGAVKVQFKKDLPYLKDGKAIESLKDNPQFKKGDRAKLRYDVAGKLAKAGYLDIMNSENLPIDTKVEALKKD